MTQKGDENECQRFTQKKENELKYIENEGVNIYVFKRVC